MNITLLTMVFVAATLVAVVRKDTPTDVIIRVGTSAIIPSAILAVVLVLIVSLFSWRAVRLMEGSHLKKIDENTQDYFEKRLWNVVEEVYIASGSPIKMPQVYISDSNVLNAYALATPRGSQMIFTKKLVETLNREELTGVAAHEWGHILAGDSKAMTKLIAIASLTSLVSSIFTRIIPSGNSNSNGNGKNNPIAIVVLILAFVFLMLSPLIAHVAQMFMSRKREQQADIISVQLTKNPNALAGALYKISAQANSSDSKKFNQTVGQLAFFSNITSTHPSLESRIDMLRKMGATI